MTGFMHRTSIVLLHLPAVRASVELYRNRLRDLPGWSAKKKASAFGRMTLACPATGSEASPNGQAKREDGNETEETQANCQAGGAVGSVTECRNNEGREELPRSPGKVKNKPRSEARFCGYDSSGPYILRR